MSFCESKCVYFLSTWKNQICGLSLKDMYISMYVYTYIYMYVLFPVCILCFTLNMCYSVRMSGYHIWTGGPLAIGYSGVLPALVRGGWV